MATHYFKTPKGLGQYLTRIILPKLLEYLSKKVVEVVKENLANSYISTRTLQECVAYKVNTADGSSTIFIDYEYAQAFASEARFEKGRLVEWGHLTNTFSGSGGVAGSQEWNSKVISFKLAEWLESGGNGDIGNQPIIASHWFSKSESIVRANLPKWVREFFIKNNMK